MLLVAILTCPLLALAGGGVDQSSTSRKNTKGSYIGEGHLMGGRGVIFPDSHRICVDHCLLSVQQLSRWSEVVHVS